MPVFDVAALEATMPDPDAVRTAATALLTGANAMDSVAEAAAQSWGKLQAQGVYVIDGAEVVFSAHQPITTASADLAADFGTLDKAANVYADEVEALKIRLADAKTRAASVDSQIADDEDWEKNEDLVNEQNSVMDELNSIAADLSSAERVFANALNAVHGGPEYVEASEAGPGEGQVEYGYSRDSLNAAAVEGNVPWGHPQEYDKPWYQDVGDAVSSFGKGVWSGVTGTITGLGNMVGFGGSEAFAQTWKGLGTLATDLAVVAVPGVTAVLLATGNGQRVRDAGSNLLAVGKAAIHWDEWKTDPAYAAGASSFDLASILLTAGAGATAKVGSVASKVSDIAAAGGKAGRAVEVSGLGAAANVTVKITDLADKLKIDTARLATNVGNNILGGGKVDLGQVGHIAPEPATVRSGVPAGAAAPDPQTYRAGAPAAAAVPEPAANRAGAPAAAAPPEPPARRGAPAAAAPEPSNNRAGAPAAAAADAVPPRKPDADTQPARNDADDTDADDVDETVRPETEERVLVNVGAEPSHASTAAVPDGVRAADTNAGTDSRGAAHTVDAPSSDRAETGSGSGTTPGTAAVDSTGGKPAAASHVQAEAGAPANRAPEHGTPANRAPEHGTPANGAPEHGTPANGAPEHGTPAAHMELGDAPTHAGRGPDDVQTGAADRGEAPEGGETHRGSDDTGSDSGAPDGDPAKPMVTYDAQGRAETVEYVVGDTRTTHVVSTRNDQIAQLRRSLDPESWNDADGLLRAHLSPEDYRRLDDLRNPDGTLPPKVAEAQVAELVEKLFGAEGRGNVPDGLSPLEGALREIPTRYYYDLTDAQATLVHDIRHMLGTGDTTQPFQKILSAEEAAKVRAGTDRFPGSVGGFVSQASDTVDLRTVDEIILGLRLDYVGLDRNGLRVQPLDMPYRAGQTEEVFAVRFHVGGDEAGRVVIPDGSNHARVDELRRDRRGEAARIADGTPTPRDVHLRQTVDVERELELIDKDGQPKRDTAAWPNTGHGFTSSRTEHTPIVPELRIDRGVELKDGSEMWRIDRNGKEVLVGIYDAPNRAWISI